MKMIRSRVSVIERAARGYPNCHHGRHEGRQHGNEPTNKETTMARHTVFLLVLVSAISLGVHTLSSGEPTTPQADSNH